MTRAFEFVALVLRIHLMFESAGIAAAFDFFTAS